MISTKDVQLPKAFSPTEVTPAGTWIEVSCAHPKNFLSLIEDMLLPRDIVFSDSPNRNPSRDVGPFPVRTVCVLSEANAFSPRM